MTIRAGEPVTRELVAWVDHVNRELARVRGMRGDGALAVSQDAGGVVIHGSGPAAFDGAKVLRDFSATTINDNTLTTVDFTGGTVVLDEGGYWSASSPSRLTSQGGGVYLVGGYVRLTIPSGQHSTIQMQLRIVGAGGIAHVWAYVPNTSPVTAKDLSLVAASPIRLTAGQAVELTVLHNSDPTNAVTIEDATLWLFRIGS